MTTRVVFLPTFKFENLRTCGTCKHQTVDGKCRLFGKVSLVTGEMYQHPAMYTRNSELCGEEGMYWEPSPKFQSSTDYPE
jgi:hypothetical protein